jgi:hypothetical protein
MMQFHESELTRALSEKYRLPFAVDSTLVNDFRKGVDEFHRNPYSASPLEKSAATTRGYVITAVIDDHLLTGQMTPPVVTCYPQSAAPRPVALRVDD